MEERYGRWPESCLTSETLNWKEAKTLSAGIDLGTTSTQAVILADGEIYGWANIRTGADFGAAADAAFRKAAGKSGPAPKDIRRWAATGFGRAHVKNGASLLNEVICHSKGARFMFGPSVRTVADLGGQNTKAMLLYDWDRLREFKVSDKCATGMGRHIEEMCELLEVPLADIGPRSLDVKQEPEPVSTTCGNFACPETIGLLRPGFKEPTYGENEVIAAYIHAVAWRILSTLGKLQSLDIGDLRVEGPIAFTGGLAKNEGITKRLERECKLTALTSAYDPQLAGAIGAALLAE